jgi:aryl-alcohol dehydrogenase-like predicted oxidoreductase
VSTASLLPSPLGFGAAPPGNIFRPVPEEEAAATVRAAWEAGIRYFDDMVAGGPYSSGALVGGPHFEYAEAPAHIVERAGRIPALAERHGISVKAAGLRFCLAHPAVAAHPPARRSRGASLRTARRSPRACPPRSGRRRARSGSSTPAHPCRRRDGSMRNGVSAARRNGVTA